MINKGAYKYQLSEHKKSIFTFYSVVLAVLLIIAIFIITRVNSGESRIMGLDMATAIFLFVSGLCCYKESFLMLMQNGVSRKCTFLSRVLVMFSLAFIMAVIDRGVYFLGRFLSAVSDRFEIRFLYEMALYSRALNVNTFLEHLKMFAFDFLFYVACAAFGYLIAVLFYRLNKTGKVAVGAGVPIGLFIILPILDSALFHMQISKAIGILIKFALGVGDNSANPYMAMLSFSISSAIFFGLSWLLMRRAVVKA